jgi:hypothetical protein
VGRRRCAGYDTRARLTGVPYHLWSVAAPDRVNQKRSRATPRSALEALEYDVAQGVGRLKYRLAQGAPGSSSNHVPHQGGLGGKHA